MNPKSTLFVTRFGLSDRTAIGVQTKYLLRQFPNHIHAYWNEGLLDRNFPRSRRIEGWFRARIPFLKKENSASRLFSKLRLDLWEDDMPSVALVASLTELKSQLSSVYVAPIDAKDARRMKAVVTTLQKPFVVHLWDFLDNGVNHDATRWLIVNATHVFCLNPRILKVVRDIQPSCSILTFTRRPARVTASHRRNGELVVAIMGDIGSYREGVECLVRAVKLLRRAHRNCRIRYIGRRKTLKQCGFDDCGFMTSTGFVASPEERDRILSECDIGFMPGPARAPEIDARSGYSIPSRILDFMAVGLPLFGTVHPNSATYEFCHDLEIASGLTPSFDSKALARIMLRLADQREWNCNSQRGLAGFEKLACAHELASLIAAFQAAGRDPKSADNEGFTDN